MLETVFKAKLDLEFTIFNKHNKKSENHPKLKKEHKFNVQFKCTSPYYNILVLMEILMVFPKCRKIWQINSLKVCKIKKC